MKKFFVTILLGTIFMILNFSKLNSTVGLGTRFATIVLEKLEPGNVYNLTKLRNLPLVVINSGSTETEVVVETEIPSKEELKEGYEPIPDPTWIKYIPNKFKLKPQESYPCDVVISIPDDKNLVGKHFQAKIWTHTAGEDLFGAGVVNRIFLSIGTLGPESVQKAKKKEILFSFNFDTDPREIYLNIPLGKKVDVLKEFDKTIKLINKSKNDIIVKLESVENFTNDKQIFQVPANFEFTPNVKFLSFEKKELKVKKNSIQDAKFYVQIPNEEIYYNKKYMFLVKVSPIKPELPVEFYTKVFVTVNK